MSFRGHLRPGQGARPFYVLRRKAGVTSTGRPQTMALEEVGSIVGIISQASTTEVEQFKQKGSPITHTIVQRGTVDGAHADDVLELRLEEGDAVRSRYFFVQGEPRNPGMLGHFLVYHVEERADLE